MKIAKKKKNERREYFRKNIPVDARLHAALKAHAAAQSKTLVDFVRPTLARLIADNT